MAHAGTPTDLAQKPATSSTGLWQALLAIIAVLAIGAGVVLIGTTMATSRNAAPAADGGYTQIETLRGGTTFAAADNSYTQVEKNRGGALTTVGSSVTQGEKGFGGMLSGGAAAPTTVQGTAPDYSPGRILGHRGAMIDQ